MFNKPNLFPKVPDPSAARSSRPAGLTTPGSTGGTGTNMASGTLSPMPDMPSGTVSATLEPKVTDTPVTEAAGSASSLIVGPHVKLKGAEILDCDTLVVEGRVEATMDSRVIRISEAGAFSGKVGIDVAEIHGVFEGELTARQQLIIHATGRVSGKIRYGRILIEEGGEVSGDVQPLASADKDVRRTPEKMPVSEVRPLTAVSA
ncbi:MAG: polymer-forming cytoskeletal protein [Azoarcus sp.]|nr:polymer-forming cytoskeletal protein [Azoarcus sp.]